MKDGLDALLIMPRCGDAVSAFPYARRYFSSRLINCSVHRELFPERNVKEEKEVSFEQLF